MYVASELEELEHIPCVRVTKFSSLNLIRHSFYIK